jgi:uncharacterized protein YjgD (DUF1641 family)
MHDPGSIQVQIDAINQKLDVLLEYMQEQRMKSSALEDLLADLSIMGKDIYDTAVTELEHHAVELDPEMLKQLTLKLLKNVPTFVRIIDIMESMVDLAKDAGPMVNEMIIDFTRKLHDLEKRGYMSFFRESGNVMDNIITHFSADDVSRLADNIVTILLTIRNLTQPEVLKGINNAVKVFNSMETEKIPDMGFWQLVRELRSKEMRQGFTFIVLFMKNLSKLNSSSDTPVQ